MYGQLRDAIRNKIKKDAGESQIRFPNPYEVPADTLSSEHNQQKENVLPPSGLTNVSPTTYNTNPSTPSQQETQHGKPIKQAQSRFSRLGGMFRK